MTQPTQKQLDELQRADDMLGWEIAARAQRENRTPPTEQDLNEPFDGMPYEQEAESWVAQ